VALSDQISLALPGYFELQREGFVPEATHISRDLDQIIKNKRLSKVEMDLDAWKPDVKSIEYERVSQAYRSKELGLGDLEKPQKLPVINNPGPIDV
jgi:hypothetical protein